MLIILFQSLAKGQPNGNIAENNVMLSTNDFRLYDANGLTWFNGVTCSVPKIGLTLRGSCQDSYFGIQIHKGCGRKSVNLYFYHICFKYTNLLPHPLYRINEYKTQDQMADFGGQNFKLN